MSELGELYDAVQALTIANPTLDDVVLRHIRILVNEFTERYQISADVLYSNIVSALESDEE
ncbi:MAG: hypothetical protein EPO21_04020 [Chloroflexota bacterium]|nr:MAG: hypothetical protein EPO21_04020 [Chloroflexota bacterium]